MDYINIPSCALLRHGTVIVRLKLDVPSGSSTCSCTEKVLKDHNSEAVQRLSLCEQCSRTKLNSKYSDCGSVLVNNSRPYRTRAARSRYVNVFAAVCLLLIASDLSLTAAAPHRSRPMERSRRSSDETENPQWANPCDVAESVDGGSTVEYNRTMAQNLVTMLNNALTYVDSYKDDFASYAENSPDNNVSYDNLMSRWANYKWMEKWVNPKWYRKELEPSSDLDVTDGAGYTDLVKKENFDEFLPNLHKGLKLVLAAMNELSLRQLQQGPMGNADILKKLSDTRIKIKMSLCEFTDLLNARKLQQLQLLNNEIPKLEDPDKTKDAILLFRDSYDYMKHLRNIMEALYAKDGQ